MENFVKLPLFLGATCLIAAGLLSGVVAITDPVISDNLVAKANKVYENLYEDQKIGATELIAENVNDSIVEVIKVEHSDKVSAVYKLKSKSSYETLTFYAGISLETKTVDAYYLFDKSTASLGYDNFKKNESIASKYNGYDGTSSVIVSGTTITSKAVKVAIDAALTDFNSRTWGA